MNDLLQLNLYSIIIMSLFIIMLIVCLFAPGSWELFARMNELKTGTRNCDN